MENKLLIAVLIPTMNRPLSLRRTLEGYLRAEKIPDHVVVVDQSEKETDQIENKKILQTYADKIKTTYVFQEKPSLTKARNTAVSLVEEEILVFSDDDVEVKKDTLLNVVKIMDDSKISMIAGWDELTPVSKSPIGYLVGTKSFVKRKTGHVTRSMLGRFPDEYEGRHLTEWAMGYFFVVRKSLLDKWKLKWDEKLTSYAYAEDLDFSYSYYKKSKAEDKKCILDDKIVVAHLASKEYRIPSRKHIFMYIINRAYLLYKHDMGNIAEILMEWCNFCFLIRSKISKENYGDYRDAIKCYKRVKQRLKCGELLAEFYQ